MNRKPLLAVVLPVVLVCLAGTVRAQSSPPTFQSIGLPDVLPGDMTEAECRVCHTSGVPDRHHALEGQPIPQDSLVPYPDADGDGNPDAIYSCLNCHDPNMTVVRDCVVCHNAGSPHHTNQLAVDLQCSACHGSLVEDWGDGHYVPTYPPSLVTPYRGLDGDGYENWPFPTLDLASDGSGTVLDLDVEWTEQGPPFFAVANIGPLGTVHVRTEPNDLSFKPAGSNNDFVIRSTRFDGETFQVEFLPGPTLAASWNSATSTLTVELGPIQTAIDVVNTINAATAAVDVVAQLGYDGDDPVADLLAAEHYEPIGGDPVNNRGFGAGSCRYCHDTDGVLDAYGQPAGQIWDNRTLHHKIGLPDTVNGPGGPISKCDVCHDSATASEQSGPDFDYAIRYCERCHGPNSLHNIQADSPNPSGLGTIVVGGEDAGYGHVGRSAGPDDSDCWGCHGFPLGARAPLVRPIIPTLDGADVVVITAGQAATVSLGGSAFVTEDAGTVYESNVRLTAPDGSSVILQPAIADQGRMSVSIPLETLPGNYDLRAVKEGFASNPVVISVKPDVVITKATAFRGRVTIHGSGFGGYASGLGTAVTADTVGGPRNRTWTAVEGAVVSWSDTKIVADFDTRPRRITVDSVYGTATSMVVGRGRPDRKKPKK